MENKGKQQEGVGSPQKNPGDRTESVMIKVTKADKAAWKAAANAEGRTLSTWACRRLNGDPTIAPLRG